MSYDTKWLFNSTNTTVTKPAGANKVMVEIDVKKAVKDCFIGFKIGDSEEVVQFEYFEVLIKESKYLQTNEKGFLTVDQTTDLTPNC